MDNQKTIGVLTSGGDAPGMNAAIRAIVRTGIYHGFKMLGIQKGYNGLINGDMIEMTLRSVSDTLQRGGTILQTARSEAFKTEAGIQKAVAMAKSKGIDGIVVIGGDGSFKGARALSHLGISTVGIPGTIDNDITCTAYTIGFDTALNTIKDAIDKIRDTATSHERCSVVEVMGKDAGHIAINVGIASGAEAIIVPERAFDFHTDVFMPIIEGKKRGKKHDIVILAEGVGDAVKLARKIEEETGIETRATILGHLQRGGSPTAMDRVIASQMGAKAIEILREGKSNRVVAMQQNKIVDFDIDEALAMEKSIDDEMLALSKILSM